MVPVRSCSVVLLHSFSLSLIAFLCPSACLLSQVELIGPDVLQALSHLFEAGPHSHIQSPVLLHDAIDDGWAAGWGVHLVALLHPRNHVLQRLKEDRRGRRTLLVCIIFDETQQNKQGKSVDNAALCW